MKVDTLNESVISDIGHAFGYYNYGDERGLIDAFPSRDAAAAFICGYVRMALRSGMLYATSERGEAYIAYRHSSEKLRPGAVLPLAKGLLSAMHGPRQASSLRREAAAIKALIRFARIMASGEPGLDRRLNRERKPYIFVGLVCVREEYQGQGYMRRVMDMAFAEGDRLQAPVILETDAKSKCDKYVHLGMELAGIRKFGACGVLYDLIRYPSAHAGG